MEERKKGRKSKGPRARHSLRLARALDAALRDEAERRDVAIVDLITEYIEAGLMRAPVASPVQGAQDVAEG